MEKAFERLELDGLLRIIGRYIKTPVGQEALAKIKALEPQEARARLDLLRRAIELKQEGVSPGLADVPDASNALERIKIGARITGKQALELAELILAGARAFDATEDMGVVPDPSYMVELAARIKASFDPDGQLLDTASPELRDIRRKKRDQRIKVLRLLDQASAKHKEFLRDQGITIRNNRFVLAFSSNAKVNGVVHGYSRTTETQFVEPIEVLEEQNRLVRLIQEEQEETQRILTQISQSLHNNHGFLIQLWESLAQLDVIWACASYALDVGACVPEITHERSLVLESAKHPVLLDIKPDEVVPLDLELGPDVEALILTGPNAGGKTVALKTIGLAFAAGACGLPFPANRLRIWVPKRFYALGFEQTQSIERGESSFTGLLLEIKQLLQHADQDTVVFFDEVLSSTDPSQGGALAFAVLDQLAKQGAISFSTTHLSVLKSLASNRPGFVGAAAELDSQGKPTYRFRMGSMGESYALEMATRVGFPEHVLERARAGLEGYQEEMALLRERLLEKQQELDRALEQVEEVKRQALDQAQEIVMKARAEARHIVKDARKQIDEMLKELREQTTAAQKLSRARKMRKQLKQAETSLDTSFKTPALEPEPGKSYRVSPLGFVGKLVEIRGKKALLAVGNTKVEVDASALYEV